MTDYLTLARGLGLVQVLSHGMYSGGWLLPVFPPKPQTTLEGLMGPSGEGCPYRSPRVMLKFGFLRYRCLISSTRASVTLLLKEAGWSCSGLQELGAKSQLVQKKTFRIRGSWTTDGWALCQVCIYSMFTWEERGRLAEGSVNNH